MGAKYLFFIVILPSSAALPTVQGIRFQFVEIVPKKLHPNLASCERCLNDHEPRNQCRKWSIVTWSVPRCSSPVLHTDSELPFSVLRSEELDKA